MRAKPVSGLGFNIGDRVEYFFVNRKSGKRQTGSGVITGVAHRRFGIFNVVIPGYLSISIQQDAMTKVGRVALTGRT